MYASGTALARDARELAEIAPVSAHRLLQLAGGDRDNLTGPLVTRAAREGDPAATEIYTEMGHWLGRGLAGLAAVLDPAVFVIGGGVSEAGDLLLPPAIRAFSQTLTGRGFRPAAEIVRAELGPEAGLVGAADLARRVS
jgi:glucokinase